MIKGALADRLLGKHRTGKARRSTADLTRRQRLAITPRPPTKPRVLYLKLLNAVIDHMEAQVKRKIYPLLPSIAKQETVVKHDAPTKWSRPWGARFPRSEWAAKQAVIAGRDVRIQWVHMGDGSRTYAVKVGNGDYIGGFSTERDAKAAGEALALEGRDTPLSGIRTGESITLRESQFTTAQSRSMVDLATAASTEAEELPATIPAAMDSLEVALTEVLRDPKLIRILRQVAMGVDESNASQLGKLLELNLAGDRMLTTFMDGFIRDNVGLITSIAQTSHDRVREIVTQAHQGQLSVRDLARQIESSFDVSRSRAVLIARDQTLKANANLTQLRQTRAGVQEYIWCCANDERVRGRPDGLYPNPSKTGRPIEDHWRLEGTRQRWDTPPVVNEATGETGHPGQRIQCRCVALPVVDNLL